MSREGLEYDICMTCQRDEAECATRVMDGGCCPSCTHWPHLDANGNPRRQQHNEHGTEFGYRHHQQRRNRVCDSCREAHDQYVKSAAA